MNDKGKLKQASKHENIFVIGELILKEQLTATNTIHCYRLDIPAIETNARKISLLCEHGKISVAPRERVQNYMLITCAQNICIRLTQKIYTI